MSRNRRYGSLRYLLFFFLFTADGEQEVEQDARDGGARDARHLDAEERDHATELVLSADADDHDHGDDCDITRIEHVALTVDHDRDALRRNCAKEEDFDAADNGLRNGIDHVHDRREEREDHRDDGRRNENGNGEDLCNRHRADVFAIVRARWSAEYAGQDVAKAVAEFKKGRTEFRADKKGVVNLSLGRVSLDAEKMLDNAKALFGEILRRRPSDLKGDYIRNVTLTSTMGPGVRVDWKTLS